MRGKGRASHQMDGTGLRQKARQTVQYSKAISYKLKQPFPGGVRVAEKGKMGSITATSIVWPFLRLTAALRSTFHNKL